MLSALDYRVPHGHHGSTWCRNKVTCGTSPCSSSRRAQNCKRAQVLVEAETADGARHSIILQNAETVRMWASMLLGSGSLYLTGLERCCPLLTADISTSMKGRVSCPQVRLVGPAAAAPGVQTQQRVPLVPVLEFEADPSSGDDDDADAPPAEPHGDPPPVAYESHSVTLATHSCRCGQPR